MTTYMTLPAASSTIAQYQLTKMQRTLDTTSFHWLSLEENGSSVEKRATVQKIRSSSLRSWLWLQPVPHFPADPAHLHRLRRRHHRHREPRERLFPENLGWSPWWLASLVWWSLRIDRGDFSLTDLFYYFAIDCLIIPCLIYVCFGFWVCFIQK